MTPTRTATLLGLVLCLATACSHHSGATAAPPSPSASAHVARSCRFGHGAHRLVVTRRVQAPKGATIAPFPFPPRVVVREPSQVRRVVGALCALPRASHGPTMCSSDWGPLYRVTALRGASRLWAVTIDATGCGIVDGMGRSRWTMKTLGFWVTLGNAMSVKPPTHATFAGTAPRI